MATTEIVNMTDDLDPRISSNVETVTFFNPLTGEKLEIELGEANRKHFQNHLDKLTKYVDAARAVELPKASKPVGSKSGKASVREWAKAHGYDVGDRGRIRADIQEAYDKAHMPVAIEGGKVIIEIPAEAKVKLSELESALENSANGNVQSLGDFTQYVDEESKVKLSELKTIDEVIEDRKESDPEFAEAMNEEPSEDELESTEPVSEEALQEMLKEMALAGIEPTREDLAK
jgi:hypothetical protein